MYDPGRDLATRYPGWVWRRDDLQGIPEVLCRRRRVILTDAASTGAATRCNLAHAIAHLDLEHADVLDGPLEARQESEADQLAARRMIPLDRLAEVLLEERPRADVACLLGVTVEYVDVRLDHLHPSEAGYLAWRRSTREACA